MKVQSGAVDAVNRFTAEAVRRPVMVIAPLFQDRSEAGQILARRLKSIVLDSDALVLALPRGGVPVGFEIAQTLGVDLDIFLVRKLGVPGQEELAMGAIASGGVQVMKE